MAHGFLSYQDTRGEVNYLGGIVNAVKNYLDNREKKEQVADMVAAKIEVENKETAALEAGKSAPRLPMGAQKMLTGGSYSKLVGRNPKALPGAVATNPEVRGGAITKMGFGGKRLKPEGFVGDQVIDISATPVNDSNQIVQAIDRLTFVSMNLLSATKEQTAIAQRQQLFFEKLARKDKAALEEAELERRRTVSGNSPYKKLKSLPPAGRGRGGRGGGGFSGSFLDTAQTVVKSAPQATKTARAIGPASRAAGTAIKSAASNAGGALVKSGTSAAKFVPSGTKIGQSAAKLLKVPASELGKIFGSAIRGVKSLPGIADFRAGRHAAGHMSIDGVLGKGGLRSQLTNFITGGPDFLKSYKSSYTPGPGQYGRLDTLISLGEQADTFDRMTRNSSAIVKSGNTIDVPINSAAADDLARAISAADAQALAAARMAAGDRAGLKPAEMATDAIIKQGTKEGLKRGGALSRMMVKQFGAAGTKSILKKIPVVAGVAGILFGIQRAMEGDFFGAGLEITSGILGATGVGAPLGLGIDGFLLARDLGMMPMAKGGILTRPTPVVAGEAGAEGFFPLEGSRGKKTFAMFGNAFVDAQMRRKKEVAEVQAEGLKLFSKDREYMKVFDLFNPLNWGGGNDSGGSNLPSYTPPPLPPLPATPLLGPNKSGQAVGGTREQRAMLDAISFAEGTNRSYGTLYGGKVIPALEQGKMTLAQVLEMQRTGMYNGQQVYAQDEYDSNATGRYQMMDYMLKEEMQKQNIDPNALFTPELQDQIMLGRIARFRGVTPEKLAQEGMSDSVIDMLAPEFASFPNLMGDVRYGYGTSYYGQGGKSADAIKKAYQEALKKQKKSTGLTPSADDMNWYNNMQSSNPNTGTPLMATSAQVAAAAFTPQAAPIIQNFYGSEGSKNNGGNMPATVAFGISSKDTGTDPFAEFRIRSLL